MPKKKAKSQPAGIKKPVTSNTKQKTSDQQPATRAPKPVKDCSNCRMRLVDKCLKLRIDIDLGHPKQNCEYWRKPLPL